MRPSGCAGGCAASTRYGPGSTCASRMSGSGITMALLVLPCARHTFRGRSHDLVREPVPEIGTPGSMSGRGNVATVETEAPAWAKAAGNGYSLHLRAGRASPRLYCWGRKVGGIEAPRRFEGRVGNPVGTELDARDRREARWEIRGPRLAASAGARGMPGDEPDTARPVGGRWRADRSAELRISLAASRARRACPTAAANRGRRPGR